MPPDALAVAYRLPSPDQIRLLGQADRFPTTIDVRVHMGGTLVLRARLQGRWIGKLELLKTAFRSHESIPMLSSYG